MTRELTPTYVDQGAEFDRDMRYIPDRITQVLWAYARDLYQTPGFGENTDLGQIKQHYYVVHTDINPSGIVPQGPDESVWLEPHGRG
jgi:glutathionyl-hydroquinone reductase